MNVDIINIQKWTNDQVLGWFDGLDDSLQGYKAHFRNARVAGGQLLNLSYEDLFNLRIYLIGHQELILDAVTLLQQLDYGLGSETLQSRALCLKCRCRSLRSSVATRRKEAEEYEYDGGVSLQRGATNQLLHLASDVLDEGKQFINWLDRSPFNSKPPFQTTRDKLVKLCCELSVTMQQSVFACVIEDAALNICSEMENCTDGIVQSNDALTIQPVSIEKVHLREVNPNEGLGLFIKVTFEGHHVVTGTRQGSIASRARKITPGDEVVAVNGRVVVGWTLPSLVAALKEQPHEVALLMKKRPQTSRSASSSNLLTVLQRSEQDRSKIFRVATPIRKINDPSRLPYVITNTTNSRTSSSTLSSSKSRDVPEDASEKMSQASGSDMSDRLQPAIHETTSLNSAFVEHSTPYRLQTQPRAIPQIAVDSSSPMDMLKFPPPPSEPYTPKGDHLAVEQSAVNSANSRSASPNSLLDIEHKRRYTVIGGSTVDQQWYEDFLAQVNRCNLPTSSKRQSQEVSSNEEVFSRNTPPPNLATSSHNILRSERPPVYRHAQRSCKSNRPVSMPPNYYNQFNQPSSAANQSASTASKRNNAKIQPTLYESSASHRNPRQQNFFDFTPKRHFHFSSNNNNNSISEKSHGDLPSRKTPPKPPPRSSSINKLSHRYSADIQEEIKHPRQLSLPEKTIVVDENEKRFSSGSDKPVVARKPYIIPVKKSILVKSNRSQSTPHLQHQEKKRLSAQLSASDDKLKDKTVTEYALSPRSVAAQNPSPAVPPIPKPRGVKTSVQNRKSLENEALRARSNSYNDLLAEEKPHLEQNRRKSAGQFPRKTTLGNALNEERKKDHVTPPQLRPHASSRASPTRLSYTTAINNQEKDSPINVGNLFSADVPQPNDNYDVRVIAGVPVRLRKSLTRFAGSKIKVPTDKGKTSQTSGIGMKGEKRVSCRDLGRGDCQGWLWKKKTGNALANNGPLAPKWAKRWVVIKDRAIYCYRSNSKENDQKAECYISLPGYTVAPAPECKRKLAFRISHVKRKTFYFAAERQLDMSRWMNKMGLAAIEYKFDGNQANGESAKPQDDYYSESDGEESVSEKSNCSNSTIEDQAVTVTDGSNGQLGHRKINRLYTTGALVTMGDSGSSLSRSKSDVSKNNVSAVTSSADFAGSKAFSKVEEKPTAAKKGPVYKSLTRSKTTRISRSLTSLFASNSSGNALTNNYERARDRAARWASKIKRKSSFYSPTSNSASGSTSSSASSSPATLSKIDKIDSSPSLDLNGIQQSFSAPSFVHYSEQPTTSDEVASLKSDATSVSQSTEENNAVLPMVTPIFETSPSKSLIDPLQRMRQSIKNSDVDLFGANRRTTLRRKMTILASDPHINEKMLRKRALERELKAKELELAYYDRLLNRDRITRSDLHSWINQHPSLVAELGTIRRLSKNKRPPADITFDTESVQDGSEGSRSSDGSFFNEVMSSPLLSVNSNNNNGNVGRSIRPRSSAIGEADLNSRFAKMSAHTNADEKSRTLPIKPSRRRKLNRNRPIKSNSHSQPYLETDL